MEKKCKVKRATVYMVVKNRETEEKRISGGLPPKASKSDGRQTSQFSKRTNLRLSHSKGSVTCSRFEAELCLKVSKTFLAWRSWYCLAYRYLLVRKNSLLSGGMCSYNLTCQYLAQESDSTQTYQNHQWASVVSTSIILAVTRSCMLAPFLMRIASECLTLRCTSKGLHPSNWQDYIKILFGNFLRD